jgi:hypothetical protein
VSTFLKPIKNHYSTNFQSHWVKSVQNLHKKVVENLRKSREKFALWAILAPSGGSLVNSEKLDTPKRLFFNQLSISLGQKFTNHVKTLLN